MPVAEAVNHKVVSHNEWLRRARDLRIRRHDKYETASSSSCYLAMAPQSNCSCRLTRRGAASWALPGIGLVLVPKCPMCIVAWLAIGSGFSIPLTTATHLRTAFVWLCWGALLMLVLRLFARLVGRPVAVSTRR
jgi:hypothetical protein